MSDESRVRELLDELLDSQATPEEICAPYPDLLPLVRERWQQVRRLRADLDALFPPQGETTPHQSEGGNLPRIPGYEVESILGRGGMGIVFRARHLSLNRPVALKMALAGTHADAREKARFQREAEAAAGLRHPNVVQIYDIGDADGQPFFTMELIDGGSLTQKLAGAPLPATQAAQLLATLAGAVQAAHEKGIVHRDLKPANVLLAADGTPKINDFGLARRREDTAGLTQTGVAVGTASYMSPEQARGEADAVGAPSDIYALGAILYELLTGRPPFRAATSAETIQQVLSQEPAPPSRLNDQVPRDIETICLKCLNKNPAGRYATAAELADDLGRFQRGEPILARRAGPVERLVKWVRRHRPLAVSLFSGVLLLNVVVAVVVWALVDRSILTRTVEADFREAIEAQRREAWADARNALERAKGRLRDGGPSDLRRRAARMEQELTLVAAVEEIGQSHHEPESQAVRVPRTTAAYEEAFREAGLMDGREDPEIIAARIRATEIAPALVDALDRWAWLDSERQDWLFEIARGVEPNEVSRRVRDPRVWNDLHQLEQFARSIPVETRSVPFLLLVSQRLHSLQGDTVPFLKRVQRAHPTDYEVAYHLAYILLAYRQNSSEAIGYYQAAIALRPTVAMSHHNLGRALSDVGRGDEAIEEIKEAVRLAPESAHYRHSVGLALYNKARYDEAMSELLRACEIEPLNPSYRIAVGGCLVGQNRIPEAIEAFRKAIEIDPKCYEAYQRLRKLFLQLGKPETAKATWRDQMAADPGDLESWDGYAELNLFLGDQAEYRRARTELLTHFGRTTAPREAERVGRACLFLPLSNEELQQASALLDRALAADRNEYGPIMPHFRFAKAMAEYRADRLETARQLLDDETLRVLGPAPRLLLTMVQHRLGKPDDARVNFRRAIESFDWIPKKATDREAWMNHLLRREAETVLAEKP